MLNKFGTCYKEFPEQYKRTSIDSLSFIKKLEEMEIQKILAKEKEEKDLEERLRKAGAYCRMGPIEIVTKERN